MDKSIATTGIPVDVRFALMVSAAFVLKCNAVFLPEEVGLAG